MPLARKSFHDPRPLLNESLAVGKPGRGKRSSTIFRRAVADSAQEAANSATCDGENGLVGHRPLICLPSGERSTYDCAVELLHFLAPCFAARDRKLARSLRIELLCRWLSVCLCVLSVISADGSRRGILPLVQRLVLAAIVIGPPTFATRLRVYLCGPWRETAVLFVSTPFGSFVWWWLALALYNVAPAPALSDT